MIVFHFFVCRLELISSLENVVLSTQYASLYSIFRFILQIFYDGGKLVPYFYFILEICSGNFVLFHMKLHLICFGIALHVLPQR